MATKLVWFRNNLRLHDNPTWFKACSKSEQLIPLYVLNNSILKKGIYKIERIENFRLQFLLESIKELKKNLNKQHSDLLFKIGNPVDIIIDLCKKYNVKKVYYPKIYAYDERKEELELEKRLTSYGIDYEGIDDETLIHIEDLPFPISHLPDTFTKFRKWIEAEWFVKKITEKPTKVPSLPVDWETSTIPNITSFSKSKPEKFQDSTFHFIGGESHAIERLNYYLWESDLIKDYKKTRDNLMGPDYSSKLSPWLSLGCISPRYIYHEIVKYEFQRIKNESTYWLIFELLWRDYFKWMALKYGPSIFKSAGLHGQKKPISEFNEELFNKWINGNTGVPFIDANMIELKLTGFMSNRGRQVVASYWVNDLKQPWLAGAAYFEKMLVDYDPTSNYGNWGYIAGINVEPHQVRYFNVEKQAALYDPDEKYRQYWLNKRLSIGTATCKI
jgi:deoxyribodipyrimidine photo-lyase